MAQFDWRDPKRDGSIQYGRDINVGSGNGVAATVGAYGADARWQQPPQSQQQRPVAPPGLFGYAPAPRTAWPVQAGYRSWRTSPAPPAGNAGGR